MGRQICRTQIFANWRAGDPNDALAEHLIALFPAVTGKANQKLTEALALGEMAGKFKVLVCCLLLSTSSKVL